MPRRLAFLAVPALFLGLFAFAGPGSAPAELGQDAPGGREKTQLARYMGEINGAVRSIPKALAEEGGRDKALAELARIQKVIIDAKAEVPSTVASIPDEKKKAEEGTHFRMEMNVLLRGFVDLEDAVLERDEKGIQKALRALGETKDEGHSEFKPKGGDR